MNADMPVVLVPGLLCNERLFAGQIAALGAFGAVSVADHRRDASMDAIAARILAEAPERFALAGLSMGGYIAYAILRAAPERVTRLCLLDTGSRADLPEQSERRRKQVALARGGELDEVLDFLWTLLVHKDRQGDAALKKIIWQMAEETGVDAFARQQEALIGRPDSRPGLAAIACPTTIIVGDGDTLTPPKLSQEMAALIPGSKLVVIPGSGHLSALEKPEAVTAAMVEWMRQPVS